MDDVVRAFLENEQRLRLVRRIGRGGFGEVWEAESESGVRSAIKVSLDSIDEQNPAVKKELENLKLVKALTGHPHIVSLLDYWVVSGYLVTRWELATDGTLLDMLERYRQDGQPGLPLKPLIRWIYEAADGLDFLHEKGIYHRDIKPQNLLVFHGHVKLGDLGLAKLVGASTASHTGSGTFGYLPPEAWGDRRLTPSVDLYCLAATYIKLRTGQEPFGTNPVEIVERQKKGEPILDGLEDWEKPLLLAALDPDPGKRFSRGARAWVRKLSTAWQKSASSSQPTDASLRRVAASFTPLQAQTQHEQASRLVPHAAPSNAATESTQKLPEVSTTARPLPRRQRYFAGVLASCVFLFLVLLVGIWILGQRPDVKVGQGDTTTTHIPNGTARPDIEVGQADTTAAQTTSDSASRPETKPGQGDTTTTQTANGTTAPSHLIVGQPDVPTLEAAIERCPPAGTIRLPAGVYRLTTPLEITKPVQLVGEGMDATRVVCDGEGYVVKVKAPKFAAWGISFEHLGSVWAHVMVIDSASVTVEGCQFLGGVWDKQNDRGGDGLWLRWAATGVIKNCRATQNSLCGIELGAFVDILLEGNTCEGNGQSGIFYLHNASGTARNNVCRNNGLGIGVAGQAAPTLEGNTCDENKGCGIAYFDYARGTARDNACRNNPVGISVWYQAAPTLEGNTCEGNKQSGIAYLKNAGGTARKNVCRNNGLPGIAVQGQAAPRLEGNACEGNKGSGIAYFENAGGTARNNVCRNNGYNGIEVWDQAAPTLEDNTCEGNLRYGIAYFENGGGIATRNVCRGNREAQIWIQDNAKPSLQDNDGEVERP